MIPVNTINLTFMFPFYMMVGDLSRLSSNSIFSNRLNSIEIRITLLMHLSPFRSISLYFK